MGAIRETCSTLVYVGPLTLVSPKKSTPNLVPHPIPLYFLVGFPCRIGLEISSLTCDIQPLNHIFHNPWFPPGIDIGAFKWRLAKGMYHIGYFLHLLDQYHLVTALTGLNYHSLRNFDSFKSHTFCRHYGLANLNP